MREVAKGHKEDLDGRCRSEWWALLPPGLSLLLLVRDVSCGNAGRAEVIRKAGMETGVTCTTQLSAEYELGDILG